jgi:hypothetical protein
MNENKMNRLNLARLAKYERERQETIARLLSNTADDGRFGRAFEVSCARGLSAKTTVSAQGRVDVSIKMEVNGVVKYIDAECKTNGGRIDDLLNGSNKSKFVIYKLATTQKHKATKKAEAWVEARVVPAVIIPTALFLEMLRDCNAMKAVAHNGVQDGIAIQCSSKKMYERLTAYVDNYGGSVVFDRDETYSIEEFDGLEL